MDGKAVILLPSESEFGRQIALYSSVTFPILPMVTMQSWMKHLASSSFHVVAENTNNSLQQCVTSLLHQSSDRTVNTDLEGWG